MKNLDNEFEEPAIATCYNDLAGISGVTIYGSKDYDPTTGKEKFEVNAKDCSTTQTCKYECNGKDCLFAKHQNNDLYKPITKNTVVTIPCIFTMKVQRDQAIAATTSSVLDAIFEIDYGVNVFKLDKSESSVFYKTTTSELMLLPYPTWNEDYAAGEATQVSGFFNMAYF